eukprot:4878030-Prymnesium_polylepis.1
MWASLKYSHHNHCQPVQFQIAPWSAPRHSSGCAAHIASPSRQLASCEMRVAPGQVRKHWQRSKVAARILDHVDERCWRACTREVLRLESHRTVFPQRRRVRLVPWDATLEERVAHGVVASHYGDIQSGRSVGILGTGNGRAACALQQELQHGPRVPRAGEGQKVQRGAAQRVGGIHPRAVLVEQHRHP